MPATIVRSQAGNLPAEMTSFIGRHREVAELKRLLQTSRLVTVTGLGGAGKTRLALTVAGQVRRVFADGVWFVDLGALNDPDLVADQVGIALGLRDHSVRIPVDALSDSRQRSLHALIAWSFDLCSPEEQVMWMRLRVFPGTFDLDAATAICADEDLDHRAVLTALAGLVDQSLL